MSFLVLYRLLYIAILFYVLKVKLLTKKLEPICDYFSF